MVNESGCDRLPNEYELQNQKDKGDQIRADQYNAIRTALSRIDDSTSLIQDDMEFLSRQEPRYIEGVQAGFGVSVNEYSYDVTGMLNNHPSTKEQLGVILNQMEENIRNIRAILGVRKK